MRLKECFAAVNKDIATGYVESIKFIALIVGVIGGAFLTIGIMAYTTKASLDYLTNTLGLSDGVAGAVFMGIAIFAALLAMYLLSARTKCIQFEVQEALLATLPEDVQDYTIVWKAGGWLAVSTSFTFDKNNYAYALHKENKTLTIIETA